MEDKKLENCSKEELISIIKSIKKQKKFGLVWEDKPEADTNIGNGIKDSDEALIGGLTTQVVEKVSIDGIDYDFVWPTREALNCLGGRSMKD